MKIDDKFYRELRCQNCRKFVIYEYVLAGRLAFTCPRCGELSEWKFKHFKTAENVQKVDAEYIINPRKEVKK